MSDTTFRVGIPLGGLGTKTPSETLNQLDVSPPSSILGTRDNKCDMANINLATSINQTKVVTE
jgi:hypothetical protein